MISIDRKRDKGVKEHYIIGLCFIYHREIMEISDIFIDIAHGIEISIKYLLCSIALNPLTKLIGFVTMKKRQFIKSFPLELRSILSKLKFAEVLRPLLWVISSSIAIKTVQLKVIFETFLKDAKEVEI